jgi:hypothetical protein
VSGAASLTGPLRPLHDAAAMAARAADRETDSGIYLPAPDPEKGHPIVICNLDVPALAINIAAPEPGDLLDVAHVVTEAQQAAAGGEPVGIWFVEPQYGDDCYITPAGVAHILTVCRGYARFVDPFATQRGGGNGRAPLHLPPGR